MAFRLKKLTPQDPVTLTVDRFGRVVIPQVFREKLGLHPGARLKVALEDDTRIVLRQSQENPPLIKKDGVPVIDSPWMGATDIKEIIREGYEERHQKFMGHSR